LVYRLQGVLVYSAAARFSESYSSFVLDFLGFSSARTTTRTSTNVGEARP